MIYFQSLTRQELEEKLLPLSRIPKKKQFRKDGSALSEAELQEKRQKQARYRAKQIFQWVYQRFVTDWDQMTDLSKELRQWLKENIGFYDLKEQSAQTSVDGTRKFLWQLGDGKTIESVIIPAALEEKGAEAFSGKELDDSEKELQAQHWNRLTACISSQVGCAMKCKFCLTGVQGLDRHLKTHEIVSQVFNLRQEAGISNIVFMGMGEPLHNFEAVARACEILLDEFGLNFSKRKVTISTSGLVPKIQKLGERVGVSLAISLNGTTDRQRTEIMPVNKRWNIEELLETAKNYPQSQFRRVTFEYVLLKDVNDSLEDAQRLAELVRPVQCKINLIPFNEHPGAEYERPDDATIERFQKYLLDQGYTTTVRISRGRDILAACGQLRSIFGTARGTEKHPDWAPEANTG